MATAKNQQIPDNRKRASESSQTQAGGAPGCCDGATSGTCPDAGCRIEAVVSVDARGQLVLPKDVRTRAGIRAGDRLLVVGWERDGQVCCLTLLKTGVLTQKVREYITP